MTCENVEMIEPIYRAFHKLIKLKTFHNFDEIYDVCWFIDSLYCCSELNHTKNFEMALGLLLDNINTDDTGYFEIDDFISDLFSCLGKYKNVNILMFIDWLKSKNIPLNRKYPTHCEQNNNDDIFSGLFQKIVNNRKGKLMTIHSIYLRNVMNNLTLMNIKNLRQLIQSNAMIDSEDLKIYADLPEKIEEDIILKKLTLNYCD
jgi:hypothetical protein